MAINEKSNQILTTMAKISGSFMESSSIRLAAASYKEKEEMKNHLKTKIFVAIRDWS